MDTSRLVAKYKKHDSFFKETMESFKAKKIVRPIANEILTDLSQRTTQVFEGLLTLAEKDNLYSSFILYRSILEHFYKSFFIFAKTVRDNSDEIAENYQKHYLISEYLAEQAGVLEMEDLINESPEKTDFLDFLSKKFPELGEFDKDNQKEISAAIKYFNVKAIAKFFFDDFSKKDDSKNAAIIAKTIPEYSHVSTFTHGGAYASKLMANFQQHDSINQELDKIIGIAFTCSCMTKENIFSTYEPIPNFLDTLKHFQEIRSF